jgi:hypothetical protein
MFIELIFLFYLRYCSPSMSSKLLLIMQGYCYAVRIRNNCTEKQFSVLQHSIYQKGGYVIGHFVSGILFAYMDTELTAEVLGYPVVSSIEITNIENAIDQN